MSFIRLRQYLFASSRLSVFVFFLSWMCFGFSQMLFLMDWENNGDFVLLRWKFCPVTEPQEEYRSPTFLACHDYSRASAYGWEVGEERTPVCSLTALASDLTSGTWARGGEEWKCWCLPLTGDTEAIHYSWGKRETCLLRYAPLE